jgi:DNA-directed RNA polymerase subunit RPC12/RpoP
MCSFKLSEDNYIDLSENYGGLCMACGTENYGVEPDARGYKCEECGNRSVYGAEELLLMGEIEFYDDECE